MNFSRIDDETIRCLLTSEDLEENGLKLEDFFHNSEHAREFLQTVVERAKEEVGYEFAGGALAMQVSPMPENGLSITFSEKADSFWKGLTEHLKDIFLSKDKSEVTDFMEQTSHIQETDSSKIIENLLRGFVENRLEKMSEEAKLPKKEQKKEPMSEFLLYRFSSLEYIENFCKEVPSGHSMKSKVYYLPEKGIWFLAVWRGQTPEDIFRGFCARALEYGSLVSDNGSQMAYIKEHGDCILEKDAIHILETL